MSEVLLEVCDIACERGERMLFQNLSFSVEAGTLVRLAGSNGAGKTTLLRLIAGLMRPLEGEVKWRGEPVHKAAQDYWRELCYIGHRNGVKEEMTVLENVLLNAGVASLRASEKDALDALDAVGLTNFVDSPVGHLSQGQHRRVALARLWLSKAVPLWILDEPFTALDVRGVARLADLIAQHCAEGGIVVLVTHQEVPVRDAKCLTIEPEKWAPRRRTRIDRAMADGAESEGGSSC